MAKAPRQTKRMLPPPNPLAIVTITPTSFVDPGAAIVCATDPKDPTVPLCREDGLVVIYFEFNRYAASNLTSFAERLRVAAWRLVSHAPTIARALVPRESLYVVGWYDYVRHDVTLDDRPALRNYAGEQALLDLEALCSK